jgi:hypothetical protein
MCHDRERARVETFGERIVEQEVRHLQQPVVAVAVVIDRVAIALQRAEVVDVTELGAELLEDRPVALGARSTEFALEMLPQVGDDPVVVEQRVVDIEQEDDARARDAHGGHRSFAPSVCQPPSSAISSSAARGPHEPRAYGRAAAWSTRTPSTTAHAASTAS